MDSIARKSLSNLGIHVYGLAAVALGVIGLIWGDFATVWQPVPTDFPHRVSLAYLFAVCMLMGGVAVQWRRTARIGLLLLAFLNLIAALLWIRRIVGYPRIFGTWGGFAEEFSMVVAAVMMYAVLERYDTVRETRIYLTARILFGLCAVAFGLSHFFALPITASMVPKWIPPGQMFWAVATGAAHLLAGLAILSGIQALLAARLLTLMLIIFGLLVWAPSLFNAPHTHMAWTGNAINLAITGAAWMVADALAVATGRRP